MMSSAPVAIRFREAQFTPAEAAAITDVPLHLQRDWRSQELLRAREGGRASFAPRDLAEMRVMMRLRGLGLPLKVARRVAVDAAPGVIFAALGDHRDRTVAVEAAPAEAASYVAALEDAGDHAYLLVMAELDSLRSAHRHVFVEDGECRFVSSLTEGAADETQEAAGLVNLWAVAAAIARLTPRPLFTLIPPRR